MAPRVRTCEWDSGDILLETFGGHSIHAIDSAAGTTDLLGWAAFQSGRWGIQGHHAWAADFEFGFQLKLLPGLKPWLRAGFTRETGDDDPTDDRHSTFFQLLTTPRIYARFPFFNMMNTEDTFVSLIIRPHRKVRFRVKGYVEMMHRF